MLLPMILTAAAFGCTCTDYAIPVCDTVRTSDVVFVGRVIRLIVEKESGPGKTIRLRRNVVRHQDGPQDFVARFHVLESVKGEPARQIDIRSSIGTSCETPASNMRIGQVWTVFAHRSKHNGELQTEIGSCTKTRKGRDKEILEQFRDGSAREKVVGRITKGCCSEDGLAGARITVSGENFEATATTVASRSWIDLTGGRFEVEVPRAGRYIVAIELEKPLFLEKRFGPVSPIANRTDGSKNVFSYTVDVPKGLCSYSSFGTYARKD